MEFQNKKHVTEKLLIPDESRKNLGCKRIVISNGWYQVLVSKNAELIDNSKASHAASDDCIVDFMIKQLFYKMVVALVVIHFYSVLKLDVQYNG